MRGRTDPPGDAGSVQPSEGRGIWSFPDVLPRSEKGCWQMGTLVSDQPEALVPAGLVIWAWRGRWLETRQPGLWGGKLHHSIS